MIDILINELSRQVNIPVKQVFQTVNLLDDGCTIPFISRYRKEETGGLSDIQVQSINECYFQLKELLKRKEYILGVIDNSGQLTAELSKKINDCWNAVELDDEDLNISLINTLSSKKNLSKKHKRQQGIIGLIKKNPNITMEEMADIFGVDPRTIHRDVEDLKGIVEHIGSTKGGYWIIIANK